MKKLLRKILDCALCAGILLSSAQGLALAVGEEFPPTENTENSPEFLPNEIVRPGSMIYLPDDMRAVFAAPGEDFDDFSALCEEIGGYGLNSVIIRSATEKEKFYDLELGSTGVLEQAILTARENGVSAFITLDVNALADDVRKGGGGLKEGFAAAAHKFVMKYACDGIILTNYYAESTPEAHAEYLRSGSGIGYEKWLYETNQYVFRTVCDVIHKTNNTTAAGVLIEDMWANKSANELGSDTSDPVSAYYDGFCDTKKYIERGYADFVIVKAYGSTENTTLNFEKVVRWWNDVCESGGAKLYVCHLNERVGVRADWHEDQLLRQLTVLKEKFPSVGGSCFHSLKSLRANPLNSTETLKKFFNNQIDLETLFEDLEMVTPKQLNFHTYDTQVKFMGTFDKNFDVYYQGSKIKLNEAGNFYILQDLNVGKNKFVFEHKGKKITYSIERRVDPIKSIENTGDVVVEGGTVISLVAVAYSGSAVSASINGNRITLTEKSTAEQIDANGSYSEFIGYYTVPDGIIGKEQPLGKITFYADYKGLYDEYATGGSVTVEAKPEPPQTGISFALLDQSNAGNGEVVGTMDPLFTDDYALTLVKTNYNGSNIYDAKTSGRVPSPTLTRQPAGTLDYFKSETDGYIITTSGRRYLTSSVTLFEDRGLGTNALVVKEAGVLGNRSYITMSLDKKITVNVTTSQSFVQAYDGPFGVEKFNAQYVYVTFDNITSVTALPSFEENPLFSAGIWEIDTSDDVPKFRIKLTLRQAGIFSGVSVKYTESGDLRLEFPIPTKQLAGKVIVIDPGHGYKDGLFDPGAIGGVTEQSVNAAVSKKLEQRLTEMGAVVLRLPTETTDYSNVSRPQAAKAVNADMFLSIHCNANTKTSAHGSEAYYYTPWSQPLAELITDNLSKFFDDYYSDGTKSNRGEKYSYYIVTEENDFPSVLIEMGFITNERECLVMANSANQDKLAEVIAASVAQYFARSAI